MSDHGMKLIGQVSSDLHRTASWVRVSVMQIDGIPLSLKVHRGSYARELFVKGRAVEITQSTTHNTYRYNITEVYSTQQDWADAEARVMTDLMRRRNKTHPCTKYGCRKKIAEEDERNGCRRYTTTHYFEESQEEPTEEHVSFYIGSRYYGNLEQKKKLGPVLREALDMTSREADSYMQDYGFWVVCRASQFAKFMVYRDRVGITNGFIDLRVQIEGSSKKTNQINVCDRG